MPTTRIPLVVTINEERDQIRIVAGEPQYIADEDHRYRLHIKTSIAHAEVFKVEVGANGLLTTVNLRSDGRLDEAGVALAKSVGVMFESAVATEAGDKTIYETLIDLEALARRHERADDSPLAVLNGEIHRAIDQFFRTSGKAAPKGAYLRSASVSPRPLVNIQVTREFTPPADSAATSDDCAVGFCYRLPVTYLFTASFFDGTFRRTTIAVPNGSPIYAASVSRGAFATWDTKVRLSNGMLESYEQTTEGSELEAALALPANLVGGLIAGITQKGELFNARSTLIDKEIELADKRKELAAKRAEERKTESLSSKPLFSFTAGAPRQEGSGAKVGVGAGGASNPPPIGISGPSSPGNPGSAGCVGTNCPPQSGGR